MKKIQVLKKTSPQFSQIQNINNVEDCGMLFLDLVASLQFQKENHDIFTSEIKFAKLWIPFDSFGSKEMKFDILTKERKEKKTTTPSSEKDQLSSCGSSNDCLVFGKHRKSLMKYFHSFTSFVNFESSPKRIGTESKNSVVRELMFHRNHLKSYAILKTSWKKHFDALIYEFLAGKEYMNRLIHTNPLFVSTYGLYTLTKEEKEKNNEEEIIRKLESNKPLAKDFFMKSFALLFHGETKEKEKEKEKNTSSKEIYKLIHHFLNLCEEPMLSISSQYIKNAKTLWQWLEESEKLNPKLTKEREKRNHELILILFQIYFNLLKLKDTFTHYDLHTGNILIYQPRNGQSILYQYELPNRKIISFYSSYVVKIIDYGRCYFDSRFLVSEFMNSKSLYNAATKSESCYQRLFFRHSLQDLQKMYWVAPYVYNSSHDLRLIVNLLSVAKMFQTTQYLQKKLEEKNVTFKNYREFYGSPPIFSRGYQSQTLYSRLVINPELSFPFSFSSHSLLSTTVPKTKTIRRNLQKREEKEKKTLRQKQLLPLLPQLPTTNKNKHKQTIRNLTNARKYHRNYLQKALQQSSQTFLMDQNI